MQWHLQRNYYTHFFLKKIICKTNRHRRWNESVKRGTFLGGFLYCCSSYRIVLAFPRPLLYLMFLSRWLIIYSMSKQRNASVFKETINDAVQASEILSTYVSPLHYWGCILFSGICVTPFSFTLFCLLRWRILCQRLRLLPSFLICSSFPVTSFHAVL